ncbi:hypothetical protein Nmel_017588 [Mimus melanotis]
MQMNPLKR